MTDRILTQRALNRALLARQLLLERASLSIVDTVEAVGGLQTQYAPSGYVGLWSRSTGFRRSVGAAFARFIRSQLILGALYGVWAFIVSFMFGLPFGPATAFLSGLIMAIPIYGPYVSWLPVVLVALLVRPDVVIVVAAVMLIGWFIDENILAPLVRAGALQLHPIVITFAFLLGAQLAGAIGAIVAIPLAAVVQAFVVKYFEQYRADRGWPSPDDRPEQPPPDATTAPA